MEFPGGRFLMETDNPAELPCCAVIVFAFTVRTDGTLRQSLYPNPVSVGLQSQVRHAS
jgi:hypothetical protein